MNETETKLKPGDVVKINDKYGLAQKYNHEVFLVNSFPELVNGNECVKLLGMAGVWRTDGLTKQEKKLKTGGAQWQSKGQTNK